MGLFQNHMMAAAAAATADTTYTIDNSCRFNRADAAYLSKTLGTATDANRWTYSTWFKRGNLISSGPNPSIFTAGSGAGDTDRGDIVIYTDNRLAFSGGSTIYRVTTQVFRDPSAWYHLVVAVNTDESGNDMIKIYLNGSQITAFDTTNNPSSAANTGINTAVAHEIGRQAHGSDGEWDGYMSEINFIDGQQLTPSSFGETNADGVWVPVEFSGTYGNNGFFLDFESSGDLGNDVSGNNNDFTSTNLAAADQMTDTPTDNFCTINPLIPDVAGQNTAGLSEGNLKIVATTSSVTYRNPGTFLLNSGKWYWEGKVIGTGGGSDYSMLGIYSSNTALGTATVGGGAALANEWLLRDNGDAQHDGGGSSTGLGDFEVNDIIQVALDMDAKKMWFGRQNTFDGDPAAGTGESFSGIDTNIVSLSVGYGGGSGQGNWLMNFGQSSFAYTPPSGFNAVSTANITTPAVTDPSAQFQIELYTGNGTAIGSGGKAVTFTGNSSMQPDLVWIKNRDATDSHAVYDSTRGTTKQIEPDNATAQTTESEGLTTFGSDGFTVGNLAQVNTNTEDFVSWNWKEGATPGFDIVTWTGNATNRTISHSLGVVPNLMIVKGTSARDWMVYHSEMSSAPETDYMRLDTSAAIADEATIWNDTAPTSSVFSVGTGNGVNANTETYVGYIFANVEGFSKFGGYTGNGNADGPVVYCGFRPSLVIIRNTSVGNWNMYDVKRNTYNVANLYFMADAVSVAGTSAHNIDILSNGFKPRNTSGNTNDSGNILIYMAFAENPFGGDGVAPATAR